MNRSTITDSSSHTATSPNKELAIPTQVKVLIVEDDALDAELVIDRLREDGIDLIDQVVADERSYLDALRRQPPDIVLSDLSLPGFSGERALKLLRARDQRTPFVFVSGTIGEGAAIDALRAGATDYILKSNMARLASAVRRALVETAERRARDAAEDELIRSQRFETMAILAGSLSHDLRNILQPVLMASQLIENKAGDREIARMCAMIRDCCNQGLELVTAMLGLARGGEGVSSNRIRLAALLEAVVLLLRPSLPRSVELTIEEPSVDLELPGNATDLQQCLLNLTLNAVQAMPEGGRLRLAIQQVELENAFFRDGERRAGADYVRIQVEDTGIGMDAATLARLFTPFFTTKDSGNGLGLVSCRRFVDKHRGLIRVHSEPGHGSRFDLYLPLAATEEVGANGRTGGGRPVLVLCDTGPLCQQLLDILDQEGYAPVLAGGDSDAVRRLGEREGFEAVVVDSGLTGEGCYAALDALRRAGFAGPVVLIDGNQEIQNESLAPDVVLDHPLSARMLTAALARLLADEASRSDPHRAGS